MVAVITDQKQARKLALNIASQLLRNNVLTLPVTNYVHESCCHMVYHELEKIAKGMDRRAKNIEAEDFEEV